MFAKVDTICLEGRNPKYRMFFRPEFLSDEPIYIVISDTRDTMHGGYGAPQQAPPQKAPPVPPHQNQMQVQPAHQMQMKPAITNQPVAAA